MTHFGATPPYPASVAVTGMRWDDEVFRYGSDWNNIGDNWPMTWGDDGRMHISFGDGDGFRQQKPKLTLGFSVIDGDPPDLLCQDVISSADVPAGNGRSGIKSSGMLMVNGVIYLWVRNYIVNDDYRHSRLAWSTDKSLNYSWADWHFADTFGCPEFVQFGPNYKGARDGFVYIVSQANNDAYLFSADVVMARVPTGALAERKAYQFYAGQQDGRPLWSADIGERQSIFTDPRGVQRVALTYNAGLKRYFLVTPHATTEAVASGSDNPYFHLPSLGVFDAPEPWGPWTTAYYDDEWSKDGWMIHHKFPTKWMSPDGKTMWLAFSGQRRPNGSVYTLLVRKATLIS